MIQAFEQLEKEFGEFIGNPNTVAVASGTAALHIACEVARTLITDDVTGTVQPRIAIPEYTMVACPRAARMADMQPVFVDCLDNLQMNMDLVPDNVDAVMAVHIYGNLCDIEKIAYRPGRLVIEDMAEVHGAKPHPNTFAACWSFYKNKTIHGEEGGMIAFKSPREAGLARRLRTLGFDHHHDYFHEPRGVNARMSNAHAELILPSLRSYPAANLRRHQLSARYDRWVPSDWQMAAREYPWVYPLRIRGMRGFEQAALVSKLNEAGIAARQGFKSMTRQEEFNNHNPFNRKSNAASLHFEVIYLPLSEDLRDSDIGPICEQLMSIAKIVIPELTP
jgi:dTDP-4-amino-4,6-dideoxygalactose transaminase